MSDASLRATAAFFSPSAATTLELIEEDESWSELVALGDDARRKHVHWVHIRTNDPQHRQRIMLENMKSNSVDRSNMNYMASFAPSTAISTTVRESQKFRSTDKHNTTTCFDGSHAMFQTNMTNMSREMQANMVNPSE